MSMGISPNKISKHKYLGELPCCQYSMQIVSHIVGRRKHCLYNSIGIGQLEIPCAELSRTLPYVLFLLPDLNLYLFIVVNCNHQYKFTVSSESPSKKLSVLRVVLGSPELAIVSEVKVILGTLELALTFPLDLSWRPSMIGIVLKSLHHMVLGYFRLSQNRKADNEGPSITGAWSWEHMRGKNEKTVLTSWKASLYRESEYDWEKKNGVDLINKTLSFLLYGKKKFIIIPFQYCFINMLNNSSPCLFLLVILQQLSFLYCLYYMDDDCSGMW